jgi:hypothetical protein
MSKASLPDAQPIACWVPQYTAMAASNSAQAGPCTKAPLRQTSAIAASISFCKRRFSRETSSIGTGCKLELTVGAVMAAVIGINPQSGRELRLGGD